MNIRSNKNQFDNLTSLSWDLGDNGAGTYHQQDSSIYKYAKIIYNIFSSIY